jgi:hypothetical protein
VETYTPLRFHDLTFVPEADEVMVGCAVTDSYAVFPATGVALLHRLREGLPPREAAAWYEENFGEAVDIDDFVATLHELRFVPDEADSAPDAPSGGAVLDRLARTVLSRSALVLYAAVIVAAVVALVDVAAVRPRPRAVFFTKSLLAVQIGLFIGGPIGMAWHEMFHVLSARRLGLPSTLAISNRLYFVVFESRLNGLLGLPRRRRYGTLLAGMFADVVFFSMLTLVAACLHDSGSGTARLVARIALCFAYATLMRFAWQFYLCLRTDLYYVMSTALGCYDLHDATTSYLRGLLRRAIGRPGQTPEDNSYGRRDLRLARWYAPVYVAGLLVVLVVGVRAMLPVAVQFAHRAYAGWTRGVLDPRFWDSSAAIVLAFGPVLAVKLYSMFRSRRQAGRLVNTA